MDMIQVPGQDRGDIILYALSTCGWCCKTKGLLGDLGVAYRYLDVDKLPGKEQDVIIGEIRKHNPDCTFPTMVIDEEKSIIGFSETAIREAFKQ